MTFHISLELGGVLGQEDSPGAGNRKIPGFSPEESHEQRSLMGYSPWSCKESDMTEHIQNINKNKMIIYFNNTK